MKLLQQFKMLKLAITTILFSLIFISDISAQAELFGYGGWMTFSSMSVQQGSLQFKDVPDYGLGVDVAVRRDISIELLWVNAESHVNLKQYPSGIVQDLFDLNVHYFQLGAVHELNSRSKARPFFAVTAGAALLDAKNASLSDEWLFSMTFGGGGKFDLSEKLGIRLQARVLVPMVLSGGGLWVGTGGASVGVGAWAPIVSFDFTAGIYIKLGKR